MALVAVAKREGLIAVTEIEIVLCQVVTDETIPRNRQTCLAAMVRMKCQYNFKCNTNYFENSKNV